jgi:hypothetical protein
MGNEIPAIMTNVININKKAFQIIELIIGINYWLKIDREK